MCVSILSPAVNSSRGKMVSDAEYEIIDGVRRSKAAEMTGRLTISAKIDDGTGRLGPVIEVHLDRLHSPHQIDVSSPITLKRWQDTLARTRRGSHSPPIIVRVGNRGPGIRDVDFQH